MAKKEFDSYLKEVEKKASSCPTVPAARNVFKKKFSFSNAGFEEQLDIYEHIWHNTTVWRVKLQAFFFCEAEVLKEKNLANSWDAIKEWQNSVSSWEFCDGLSKIYTKHLEVLPKEVYSQLKKWNNDKDLWKRRQSIVSLLYYSRTKKIHLSYNEIIPLIDNLVHDKEYYVQKGVGWSLRELYNVYPKKTFAYLKKNIKSISATAFYAATEKLNKNDKDLLKALRK